MTVQSIEAKSLKAASSEERGGQFMAWVERAGQRMVVDGVCCWSCRGKVWEPAWLIATGLLFHCVAPPWVMPQLLWAPESSPHEVQNSSQSSSLRALCLSSIPLSPIPLMLPETPQIMLLHWEKSAWMPLQLVISSGKLIYHFWAPTSPMQMQQNIKSNQLIINF